jgi:hypothetical protein
LPLQSSILAGNTRLESAASGGPSIKAAPPADDPDAVRRIQKALAALGFPLPISFRKGTGGEPDGKFGEETYRAVVAFQQRVFPGERREWDGRVGRKTLEKMDDLLLRGHPVPPPPEPTPTTGNFVCGPDVTDQVAVVWKKIQDDFRGRTRGQKIQVCNRILIPIKDPVGLITKLLSNPSPDLSKLLAEVRAHADIDGWDTLPLFQGASGWLRKPPVYDPATKGPCATPSSSDFSNPDPFAEGHEDENTCSNSVQVAGKCWLNGSVNYGTYGIMVRECSDFAANDLIMPSLSTDPFDQPLKFNPFIRSIYSLTWATMLIRAYKKFGGHPEGAVVPVAWTEATFNKGPKGTPDIPGNRAKCKCTCGSKGSIVTWDYVWEPLKPRSGAKAP